MIERVRGYAIDVEIDVARLLASLFDRARSVARDDAYTMLGDIRRASESAAAQTVANHISRRDAAAASAVAANVGERRRIGFFVPGADLL